MSKKGFTLVELTVAMALAGTLAVTSAQESQFKQLQDEARMLGNEIFNYNTGVSRFIATQTSGAPLNVTYTGSAWLKSTSCADGLSSDAYLDCTVLPNDHTTKFRIQPRTTLVTQADGSIDARTIWDTVIGTDGQAASSVMGIAAMVASGSYVTQAEDAAAAYQLPTVFCPNIATVSASISAICDTDRNTIVSRAQITPSLNPWLRTDHLNAMNHVIEFSDGISLESNSDLQSLENRTDNAWLRQVVNVARISNQPGSGQSLTLGGTTGDGIYSDSMLVDNNLLNGAVIVDADHAVMGDMFGAANVFISGNITGDGDLTIENDIETVSGDINALQGQITGETLYSVEDTLVGQDLQVNRDITAKNDIYAENILYTDEVRTFTDPKDFTSGGYLVDMNGSSRLGNLSIEGNLTAGGRVKFTNKVTEYSSCSGSYSLGGGLTESLDSSLSMSTKGNLVICQGGKWEPVNSTPSGTYAYYATSSCPSGWVKANGSNGTQDLRGLFIRAWDDGAGRDSGRSLRSWQNEAFKSHNHKYNYTEADPKTSTDGDHYWYFDSVPASNQGKKYRTTTSTGGSETRPINRAMLACMKK